MPPPWHIVFRILYRLLAALARLVVRSGGSKDLEIIVLRHQAQVLRRKVEHPAVTDHDRTLLDAAAAALPRRLRQHWIVTPETLLAGTAAESPDTGLTHPVSAGVDHQPAFSFGD